MPRALHLQVLCGNREYAGQLGAVLWPQLSAAYIATQLKPFRPQADTEASAARVRKGDREEGEGSLPEGVSRCCYSERPVAPLGSSCALARPRTDPRLILTRQQQRCRCTGFQ